MCVSAGEGVASAVAAPAPVALGVSPPISDAWGLCAARALAMRVNSVESNALTSGIAGGGGGGGLRAGGGGSGGKSGRHPLHEFPMLRLKHIGAGAGGAGGGCRGATAGGTMWEHGGRERERVRAHGGSAGAEVRTGDSLLLVRE